MVNDVPAISVILPIYKPNILQLKEALDSVLEQSFENFECICIYDSPEDSLTKILNLYAENDSRFKVINGTNNGLIPALNLGLKLSKGKYIARMDADDICLSTRFENQYLLLEDQNYDLVGGHYFVINASGKYLSARVTPITQHEIAVILSSTVPFAHSSVMMRSAFLEYNNLSYGVGECKIAEDYQLWVQMFNLGARFGNVDEWVLKYRWSEGSLSQLVRAENKLDMLKIRNTFIKSNKSMLRKSISILAGEKLTPELEETLCFLALKIFAIDFQVRRLLNVLRKMNRRSLAGGSLKFIFENF